MALVNLNSSDVFEYFEKVESYSRYFNIGQTGVVVQIPIFSQGVLELYVVNTETGEVTKGAELVNIEGSHFIGVF